MLYRFFLILFLFYVIFKIIIRYIFPLIIRYFLKHPDKDLSHSQNKKQNKKKGEINIDFIPEKNNKNTHKENFGEYIDYEEVANNETNDK